MVLGTPNTLLRYSLTVRDNLDWYYHSSGLSQPIYNAPKEITLELNYYLNQVAHINDANLISDIETNIGLFLRRVDGQFIQRIVEPFREQHTHTLYYRIKLHNLDLFNLELERAAKCRLDAEFAQALEAELSKD